MNRNWFQRVGLLAVVYSVVSADLSCGAHPVTATQSQTPDRTVEILLDVTGSVANDFEKLLTDADSIFRTLDPGTPYEIYALAGSDSNFSQLAAGAFPDDAKTPPETSSQIIADYRKKADEIHKRECHVDARTRIAGCGTGGRSCILQALRDRLRPLPGHSETRQLYIIFLTDAMEDCEHPDGPQGARVNLTQDRSIDQFVSMLAGDLPVSEAQKKQAQQSNLYFCLPQNLLKSERGRGTRVPNGLKPFGTLRSQVKDCIGNISVWEPRCPPTSSERNSGRIR